MQRRRLTSISQKAEEFGGNRIEKINDLEENDLEENNTVLTEKEKYMCFL